jgi:hypothetical protein
MTDMTIYRIPRVCALFRIRTGFNKETTKVWEVRLEEIS